MSFRLVAACCALSFSAALQAQSLGTAFTYQGELTEAGEPAFGLYDLQICLFDDASGATELACAPDFDDVLVQDGAFTLALDFGASPFVGEERWIELRIRPGAETGAFTVLSPRQLIRPAPEALRSNVADAATTAASAPWTGLTDVPGDFADGVDNDSGGTVTAVTAGTGLDGGTITEAGTIGIADGGVGAAQIAAGAVGSGQINPNEVQQRVTGMCAPGFYLRGINADGSVACSALLQQIRQVSLIVPGVPQGRTPSIEFGVDGNPIISHWNYSQGRLQVRHCNSPSCSGNVSNTVVDATANVGSSTSLAIGVDGFPVISYHDSTNGTLKVAKCTDVACADTATLSTVDPDATNVVGFWTSIDIGSDGLPVIAYHDETNGTLKVAKCVDAACAGSATITVVDPDPTNDVGQSLSLTIGADGLPVIAYYDATGARLKVAKCVDSACTGSTIITVLSDGVDTPPGDFPSIAIGLDGLPVISYRNLATRSLQLASCADADCSGPVSIATIDDSVGGPGVGAFSSLRIGPEGRPGISYYDEASHLLKFARCADPACNGPGNELTYPGSGIQFEGRDTSLALSPDGTPVIAHWSGQEGVLRLTICGTLNCQ